MDDEFDDYDYDDDDDGDVLFKVATVEPTSTFELKNDVGLLYSHYSAWFGTVYSFR